MKWIYSVFFVLVFIKINAQNSVSDSLDQYSFEELEEKFKKVSESSEKAKIYAKTFLQKAKKINDTIKIADGYYMFSILNKNKYEAILYSDSIIYLAKKTKTKNTLLKGIRQKGIANYNLSNYNKSLKYALKAKAIAEEIGEDSIILLKISHSIGLLKNVGDNDIENALIIFRDNVNLIEEKINNKKYEQLYLKSLFALCDSYNKNKKYDSAILIQDKGINYSLNFKNKDLYEYFLISSGMTHFNLKNYNQALDSLNKSIEKLSYNNDKETLCIGFIYKAKCFFKNNNIDSAMYYLKRVDSIYDLTNEVIFEKKEALELKLKYYNDFNKNQEKLNVIEDLIKINNRIDSLFGKLRNNIFNKHDIPSLLKEKEKIIKDLKNDEKWLNYQRIILISFLILTIGIALFLVRRNRIYKIRYKSLIKELEQKNTKRKELTFSKTVENDIVSVILSQLKDFETEQRFVEKYTLNSLAKKLNTNSSYLSKVINEYKKCNFTTYINDLRVEYAIRQIQSDSRFRNYTIKAIAEECGFSSAQAFSRTFYKKTGIYPSYFLKEIKKTLYS